MAPGTGRVVDGAVLFSSDGDGPPAGPAEGEAGGGGQARGPAPGAGAGAAPAARGAPAAAAPPPGAAAALVDRLLVAVSGLDRGLVASRAEQMAVDDACRELERAAPPGADYRADDSPLRGAWRLVYSSAFALTGSLGGQRPGPPAFLSPVRLGRVEQRIRPGQGTLDNVVDLLLPPLPLGGAAPVAQVCLRHDYEAAGRLTTRITFTETVVRVAGDGPLGSLPSLALPPLDRLPEPLRPSRESRGATFDNTYVDARVRVSRGDRGELRVYVRADEEEGAR